MKFKRSTSRNPRLGARNDDLPAEKQESLSRPRRPFKGPTRQLTLSRWVVWRIGCVQCVPFTGYISFFLEKNDLTKARATAERALTVINYREEAEIFNIWTAYLNMEVAYGDEATTKEVFQRACGNADSLKVHKQMAAIYSEADKVEEADEIFEAMIKKFRADSDDVWTLYGEHLMSTDRAEKARDLMKRALTSVPKQRHVPLISRFAQMEFRKGDFERGRTLFESLVTAYPKKTDVWIVYADLCLKHIGIEAARQILERACALPLSMHKLRPLFRKWMEAEQRYGDEKSRLLIREKAEKFLQSSLDDMEEVEQD
ncbi:hypothetical protein Y032_0003g1526 [Ancylostoma ceylanicum]|uniref:Pre-mRNA-splicing factor Syf1/CRNKL1-like C-terminal HAT-repeats domain-containing protein n=1 Tax=Ancylostoma ceylanicum TaxID=53326 RepID=A0A016VY51_9BILA|nr:hypothetical protein Y032_0003g1526 [Ancylostoma ceylanicum]